MWTGVQDGQLVKYAMFIAAWWDTLSDGIPPERKMALGYPHT